MDIVESDHFGPLNVFNGNRPVRTNPGGVFSYYNTDGTRRPDSEEEEEEEERVFPPFREDVLFKRRPRNLHKDIPYNDDGDGRFSLSTKCYILYSTPTDEDGNEYIYINLFQCQQQQISGKILMNVFLHNYLTTRHIPPKQNVHILLTAVSHHDQPKLNQYYKDIGFQQLDRFNNFKGNINDVLHYTNNYVKDANGLRKKTRFKTRFKTRKNANKKRKSRK